MTAYSELREKVEGASGPSRELDARISVAMGDVAMRHDKTRDSYAFFDTPIKPGQWAFLSGCRNGEDEAYHSLGQCLSIKHYTSSVDAALALVERVLPGWVWQVIKIDGVPSRAPLPDCEARLWIPSVRTQKLRVESVDGKGATPPLAILSALLRALEAKDTGHG